MSYTLYKTCDFGPSNSGLATVGYLLTGGVRTTSGVAEIGAGTGKYGATVTVANGFKGSILWDTGAASPLYAVDEINPGDELAQSYLDAAVSTRSTFAGGAVASVTAPVTISLSQTGLTPRALDSVADAALTVGDALEAAVAAAAGKESVSGTAYTVKTPYTGTVIRTFTLDSATAPTSRS